MARTASKTKLTREELQAQLEALDKQDAVARRDAEIAELRATVDKLTRERNAATQQVTELSEVIKTIHKTLNPYRDALDNATRGGLYRGKIHAPAQRPAVVQMPAAASRETDAAPAE